MTGAHRTKVCLDVVATAVAHVVLAGIYVEVIVAYLVSQKGQVIKVIVVAYYGMDII